MPTVTLLLHNIRSAHNVGSIFRTADGLGVHKIILTGYTPHPSYPGDSRLPHVADKLTKQINKTALGATTSVPFEYHDNILTWLESNTLPLVALEQSEKSTEIDAFAPPGEFVLMLGEEVEGIDPMLLEYADSIVEIPMTGMKESFNVSIAAAIAMYVLIRE